LSFRGNGRTKYAYEMLHLIHHLTKIWPKAISNIVLKNWLLNPSGRRDGFVEIDLVQEHLNFWVKVSITQDAELYLRREPRMLTKPMVPTHHGSG
jgi:hypothetical protein